jgi:hypothetical protein
MNDLSYNPYHIKANYTLYAVGDWELMLKKHLFALTESGLYDNLETFNVFAYPYQEKIESIVSEYGVKDRTKVIDVVSNRFEFPAIKDLLENPYTYNLYFHSKGLSLRDNAKSYIPSLAWNDYMTYFNVYHWRECVTEMINDQDMVGAEFMDQYGKHFYAGNFWWSTGDHLRKVNETSEKIQSFKKEENRYDCEGIASSIKGNYSELYHFYDLSRGPNPYFSTPIEYSFRKAEIVHIVV